MQPNCPNGARPVTPNRSHNWLRFGLRSLLILVAFLAVLLAWWRDHSELQRKLDRSELLRTAALPKEEALAQLEFELVAELVRLNRDDAEIEDRFTVDEGDLVSVF